MLLRKGFSRDFSTVCIDFVLQYDIKLHLLCRAMDEKVIYWYTDTQYLHCDQNGNYINSSHLRVWGKYTDRQKRYIIILHLITVYLHFHEL